MRQLFCKCSSEGKPPQSHSQSSTRKSRKPYDPESYCCSSRHNNSKSSMAMDANADDDHHHRRPMFAMICVNNVNRSTAAHDSLRAAGLRVCSYGAGRNVCFPGRSITTPRVFSFATPYETMRAQLAKEDTELFTRNGVLAMLERDIATKERPERWQSLSTKQLQQIDIVVCLDYRMFLVVLDDLSMRLRLSFKKKHLHLICLDVDDTPEDASSGSARALELCQALDAAAAAASNNELTEDTVKRLVVDFEARHALQLFYLGLRI